MVKTVTFHMLYHDPISGLKVGSLSLGIMNKTTITQLVNDMYQKHGIELVPEFDGVALKWKLHFEREEDLTIFVLKYPHLSYIISEHVDQDTSTTA